MNHYERLLLEYVNTQELAPELDIEFYRKMHEDLTTFDAETARRHYANHGRNEGRIASPAGHRIGFMAQIPNDGLVLEIGPAVRPILHGEWIRYFDIAPKDALIKRAVEEGYDTQACPEIHYVSPRGDLSIVKDSFRAVFSSHCIEHQPDFIRHLRDVSNLLEAGGRYFVIVPDKRYCFDASITESSVAEVMQAQIEERKIHSWSKIYEHYVMTTHNDTSKHWSGDCADPNLDHRNERIIAAEKALQTAVDGYVDVHAWQFTPDSFRSIMSSVPTSMVGLRLERVYDTLKDSNEFFAVMTKASALENDGHQRADHVVFDVSV